MTDKQPSPDKPGITETIEGFRESSELVGFNKAKLHMIALLDEIEKNHPEMSAHDIIGIIRNSVRTLKPK